MLDVAVPTATLDSSIRDRLLPACAVRIDVGHMHAGSGFFVAPGLVVTCHHVLDSLELTTGATVPDVRVVGTDNREYRVQAIRDVSEHDDLTVLSVEPAHGHQCALLVQGLKGGDPLVTYGAPGTHPGGVPTELRAEGMTTEDPERMKLSAGHVEPGMSGSPVLSLRTGGVCGVLKRSRDPQSALGGYAIPIQALLRLSPTLGRVSRRFHEADRTWHDVLPRSTKTIIGIGRAAVPTTKSTLQLVVGVSEVGPGWMAEATEYPVRPTALAKEHVDLTTVREGVARVLRDWGRRGRDDPSEVKRLGGILAAILPGGIGGRFGALIAMARQPVGLALQFDPGTDEDLQFMPWEQLFLDHARSGTPSDIYVACDERLAFARALEPTLRPAHEPLRRDLDVLLIDVDPLPADGYAADDDEARSDVATVRTGLERTAQKLDGLNVTRLETPNAAQIEHALLDGYDVVHYVGFGRYVPGADSMDVDELAIRGARADAYVNRTMFQQCLAAAPPALVVMQLCDGPKDVMSPDFSAFAPPLLAARRQIDEETEVGVEAVVAYQFAVSGRDCRSFNNVLYERLMAGGTVEMAVQAARRKLWMERPDRRAYLSAATFVRQPGGLALTAGMRDSPALARSSALTAYA